MAYLLLRTRQFSGALKNYVKTYCWQNRVGDYVGQAKKTVARGMRCSACGVPRILTARAAKSAMISRDRSACSIIKSLAHRASAGTSVGEKAVLVLKAKNK